MTTRGERLRSYLLARTGGVPGWQTQLVAASGVKRQTISKWTNPAFDRYPDLETLAAIATALGVSTFEIVAAMDGIEALDAQDQRLRTMMREEIEAALAARQGSPRALREA